MTTSPSRAVIAGVAVLSGSALAYEILLIRLFAIVDWHHLAFLVISIALLGYGISGTAIAVLRERGGADYRALTAAFAAIFGISTAGAFVVFERMDFNSLEILWSGRELAKLFLLYALFSLPFFFAAMAIGLTLTRFAEAAPRIYAADLIGAGCSAAAVTAILFVVHPMTALQICAAGGVAAASLFLLDVGWRSSIAVFAGAVAIIAAERPLLLPMRVSQFKELSQTLRIGGARIVEERSSPLALLSVVDNPMVPFRFAPGLSLNYTGELPGETEIFSDASSPTALIRRGSLDFVDFVPPAAPYHLRGRFGSVAIIGAGGGTEVLSALWHGATHVTAVELNAQMIDLAGTVYRERRVRAVNAEGRAFIRSSSKHFDLVQLALVDSFGGSAAGVHALSESYLYTVESLIELISHVDGDGFVVITRWIQVPPRDIVKLLATATAALERLGLASAGRIALVRSWNTVSLIIKRSELTAGEVAALRAFCAERSFDLDYAPGVTRDQTNRYNILGEPLLFDLASAIVAGPAARDSLFDRYKFFIRPATDDRPYFFHFFKWSVLPELLRLRGRGGMPLVEWGYVILIAAIAQALAAAVLFLVLPLLALRRHAGVRLARVFAYFGSIGLGFLFLEIAFIQRLTLFLGDPLYAVTTVLSSFLVFAGIGSSLVGRWSERTATIMPLVVAAIAVAELPLLATVFTFFLSAPAIVKVPLSVAAIAPLAMAMGTPFPSGLVRLQANNAAAIPWAWGINGTASVLSSMLATLIAVHFGFTAVVIAGALLYGCAQFASRS